MDAADRFLDEYRRAFVQRDHAALMECFAFPLQVADEGDAGHSFPTADAWSPVLSRLLLAYEMLAVGDAVRVDTRSHRASTGELRHDVQWQLRRADASPIYDFRASYTTVATADDIRIVAIIHDETAKLRAALRAS